MSDDRATHEAERAQIEAQWGGLNNAVNLCRVVGKFHVGNFVESIRRADVVVVFHETTPEWWTIKGGDYLALASTANVAVDVRVVKVIVPNLDMVELLTALIQVLGTGDHPGSSAFFAKKLAELSHQREATPTSEGPMVHDGLHRLNRLH